MGSIKKGILGGFSGTVGTVVGANWRGKDIIRSRPKPSGKAPTDKQMLQQAKFRLVIAFLQPLRSIQTKYFGSKAGAKSRVNIATSYTIAEAVTVESGIPELVYNKVLITKGDLTGFQELAAVPEAGAKIQFAWEDNSAQGNARPDDVFCWACYCEAEGVFATGETAAERSELTAEVQLPTYFAGQQVEVYAYFRNALETQACTSVFAGEFTAL
ncbi:MAG: hypothetical protein K0M56_03890 [Kaistella sp.]|nr:hypothetical protein [Kaistella sp.]